LVTLFQRKYRGFTSIVLLMIVGVLVVVLNGGDLFDRALLNMGMSEILMSIRIINPWEIKVAESEVLLDGLTKVSKGYKLSKRSSTSCTIGLGYTVLMKSTMAERYFKHCEKSTSKIINLGKQAMDHDQLNIADEWFTLAAKLDPEKRDPWFYIGQNYRLSKSWMSAVSAFSIAASKPEFIEVGNSDIYFSLGQLYFEEISPRDLGKSWDYYSRAIENDDFNLLDKESAFYKRGLILINKGDNERAVVECYKSLSVNPRFYWGYMCLANAHENMGENKIAEDMLKEAVDIQPNSKWAYRALGRLYYSQGRYSESLRMYERTLFIDPDDQKTLQLIEDLNNNSSSK